MSRRGFLALCAAFAALAVWAPTASAGLKVRSCGHFGYLESTGDVGWTSDLSDVSGAGIFRVVSKGVPCSAARRVTRNASPERRYRGWYCRYLSQRYEYAKIQCGRRSGRIVRWETGA